MAKKLWIENISIPAILYQEDTPSGDYLDKTNDAVYWDLYGMQVMDYIFVRDNINNLLFPICNPNYPPTIDFSGWNNLTAAQKEIMARYVLAPYALRLTIYTDQEDKNHWQSLIQVTQGLQNNNYLFTGRAMIIEKMRSCVADKVRIETFSMAESQIFFKDVFDFTEWYIRAACPDFKQWLTNEIGSPYENDGFAQKSYYSEALKNSLMDIYNGV
jgi:hypothetical protein